MSTLKHQAKTPDFEKSLDRLEKIVQEMEAGELPLEKMMKHFEDGMGLVKFCSQKLNEVEQKIELLLQQDGTSRLVPFQPEPESEDDLDAKPDNAAKS